MRNKRIFQEIDDAELAAQKMCNKKNIDVAVVFAPGIASGFEIMPLDDTNDLEILATFYAE